MLAVILAGGVGTRLNQWTKSLPKPLLEIDGKPVLEHQIDQLRSNHVTEVIMVVGYLGHMIKEYFGDGSKWSIAISYYEEFQPLGTAGAFYDLKEILPEEFLVVYGDVIFDVDLSRLVTFHRQTNADATLIVHPNNHPADSDIVVLDEGSQVRSILKKNIPRRVDYNNAVNAGVFYLNRRLLYGLLPGQRQDFEGDLLKPILSEFRIFGYKTTEYLKDMGTIERYQQVVKDVQSGKVNKRNLSRPQKAIFLDRDGTINKHVGLISRSEQLEIIDCAYEALARLNRSEYLAIVITNQSVVARNLCSIEGLASIHRKMETLLGEKNVYIDDLFYCPHHPDGGYPEENARYKMDCQCRKPQTQLIDAAVKKYNIDIASSYFIGDSLSDVQTGKNAHLNTVWITESKNDLPDACAENLLQAINLILDGALCRCWQ